MSLLSFTKCFIGAGGEQAATALTTAMVKMLPRQRPQPPRQRSSEYDREALVNLEKRRGRSWAVFNQRRASAATSFGRLWRLSTLRYGFQPRACSHGMAAYTEPEPITTVFDDQCRITGDPDRDGRCSGGASSS
jgi:hypothetical protein